MNIVRESKQNLILWNEFKLKDNKNEMILCNQVGEILSEKVVSIICVNNKWIKLRKDFQ